MGLEPQTGTWPPLLSNPGSAGGMSAAFVVPSVPLPSGLPRGAGGQAKGHCSSVGAGLIGWAAVTQTPKSGSQLLVGLERIPGGASLPGHTASEDRGQPRRPLPHHATSPPWAMPRSPLEVTRGGAPREPGLHAGAPQEEGLRPERQYLAQAAEGNIQGQREEVLYELLEGPRQLRALCLVQP